MPGKVANVVRIAFTALLLLPNCSLTFIRHYTQLIHSIYTYDRISAAPRHPQGFLSCKVRCRHRTQTRCGNPPVPYLAYTSFCLDVVPGRQAMGPLFYPACNSNEADKIHLPGKLNESCLKSLYFLNRTSYFVNLNWSLEIAIPGLRSLFFLNVDVSI